MKKNLFYLFLCKCFSKIQLFPLFFFSVLGAEKEKTTKDLRQNETAFEDAQKLFTRELIDNPPQYKIKHLPPNFSIVKKTVEEGATRDCHLTMNKAGVIVAQVTTTTRDQHYKYKFFRLDRKTGLVTCFEDIWGLSPGRSIYNTQIRKEVYGYNCENTDGVILLTTWPYNDVYLWDSGEIKETGIRQQFENSKLIQQLGVTGFGLWGNWAINNNLDIAGCIRCNTDSGLACYIPFIYDNKLNIYDEFIALEERGFTMRGINDLGTVLLSYRDPHKDRLVLISTNSNPFHIDPENFNEKKFVDFNNHCILFERGLYINDKYFPLNELVQNDFFNFLDERRQPSDGGWRTIAINNQNEILIQSANYYLLLEPDKS